MADEGQPKLRLEWIAADELADNPQNWRTHPAGQEQALRAAMAECGWAGACLYNERTGRLIDGHLRKKVAGSEPVPVLIGSWTEDQERLILATLDPLSAMAQTNAGRLDALLRQVQAADGELAGWQ